MSCEDPIQDAIKRERDRCLRIIATSKPDTSGSGMELQMRNGDDWIKAFKRVVNKRIADGD